MFGLAMHADRRCSQSRLACLTCNAACCPICAITLESIAYCRRCAAMLLDTTAVQASGAFELV